MRGFIKERVWYELRGEAVSLEPVARGGQRTGRAMICGREPGTCCFPNGPRFGTIWSGIMSVVSETDTRVAHHLWAAIRVELWHRHFVDHIPGVSPLGRRIGNYCSGQYVTEPVVRSQL
jgi:hypothetical protein